MVEEGRAMNGNKLSTPDITLMQKLVGAITLLITAGIGVAQAFGTNLTVGQSAALLSVWAALGSVLVLADAVIRNGRSRALAANPPAKAEDKVIAG
jgi:hypothetical protein